MTNIDLIIEQDPETIQFGPKMIALSEKRRALARGAFRRAMLQQWVLG